MRTYFIYMETKTWVAVLVRITIAMMKHHDQKKLGEEMVCFVHLLNESPLKEANAGTQTRREGTWRQELIQKP